MGSRHTCRVSVQELREYLAGVAWFWPGLILAVAGAVVLGGPVARAVHAPRRLGSGLVFSVGLIVASTLTPSIEAVRSGATSGGTCDLSRIGPPALVELARLNDASLNVALFLPLGLVLGLLPSTSPRLVLTVSALVLPFGIELVQLVVRTLDRACQTRDVSNNVTGLVIGLLAGLVLARVTVAKGGSDHEGGTGRRPGVS